MNVVHELKRGEIFKVSKYIYKYIAAFNFWFFKRFDTLKIIYYSD